MRKIKFLPVLFTAVAAVFCLSACFGVPVKKPDEIAKVFEQYDDTSKWNFAINVTVNDGTDTFTEYYEYMKENISQTVTTDDGTFTDYFSFGNTAYYYYDKGDGTYEKYDENSEAFEEAYSYTNIVDLTQLKYYKFTKTEEAYAADLPDSAGDEIIGSYEGRTWTNLILYVSDGKISKLIGKLDDGYTLQFEFCKYGVINFRLPDTETPTEPTGIMEKQNYNPDTFARENLQDKMLKNDGAIGLPSTGNIDALVIPVQFKYDTITQSQLNKLNIAFNGTSEQTGWESVKTYYQKASYGKLNLSFDIQSVYQAKNTASYYEQYKQTVTEGGETFEITGEKLILKEALAYYEPLIDLNKYDTNGDGAIDAVYLIYSAPVDYDYAEFYWAYVAWYYGQEQYDGLDAYFYLFAGFDFMDEDVDKLDGMKINASTYIHETGHLLGLDDYYDYDKKAGSNEGLGGADMMDYTVGDQNVYSKIMLGWLEPTIVTSTSTLTLSSSQKASAILIPLNFDNSYFCEYLLIDLYTADGINAMHSSVDNTVLYDGAAYGVRIYHVASSIKNPYGDNYGSFTDNNNSVSKIPLIKLVEADGEKKFASSGGYASRTDLWTTGSMLSKAFPSYTRHDGKLLNFDVAMSAVSSTGAVITVTFK